MFEQAVYMPFPIQSDITSNIAIQGVDAKTIMLKLFEVYSGII